MMFYNSFLESVVDHLSDYPWEDIDIKGADIISSFKGANDMITHVVGEEVRGRIPSSLIEAVNSFNSSDAFIEDLKDFSGEL